jgi:hypothetical protein
MDERMRRNIGVLLLAALVWLGGMALMSAEMAIGQGFVVVGGLIAVIAVVLIAAQLIRGERN